MRAHLSEGLVTTLEHECRYCGDDAVGLDALGRWACERHKDEVDEDVATLVTEQWYVVNHDNDDRAVRGPYLTSEAAGAVRRELESQERYAEVNLWITRAPLSRKES